MSATRTVLALASATFAIAGCSSSQPRTKIVLSTHEGGHNCNIETYAFPCRDALEVMQRRFGSADAIEVMLAPDAGMTDAEVASFSSRLSDAGHCVSVMRVGYRRAQC